MPHRVMSELSPRQRKALEILVVGGTTAEAATAAGVHVRTVQRWLHRDEFREALKAAEKPLRLRRRRCWRPLGAGSDPWDPGPLRP